MASNQQIYYKQNRIKQLRAFCYAAQTGSISEAAELVFLSQPTVTLQVQALERELDVVLFERRGPKIRLTPEGDILYRLAKPLVEGMDKLEETFASHCGRLETGMLNIAAGESTILNVLPESIRRFTTTYPGVELKLHNVKGRDGLEMIRSDEVDLAVGSLLEVPDDVTYRSLMTYAPMLITPLSHPLVGKERITLEDISPYGLILPPRKLNTWKTVDLVFKQHGVNYKVVLETGGWEVIKKYVELGIGISIVTSVCLTNTDQLARIPLADYFPYRSYGVVIRRGKFLSPQAKRFLEILDKTFSAPIANINNAQS
ncbi:LysR family transcriptional regulator [Achromatium sp. WMS2]|nr:LysR family transcriptional regulator [Achromatium sp. WMS2]